MARSIMVVLALLSIIAVTHVAAQGFASCKFQSSPVDSGSLSVSGFVTIQQDTPDADITVVANFTSRLSVTDLYLHVHTFGDIEVAPADNACWTATTLGPYTADSAPHYFLATSFVAGSGINLFGSNSVIGRSLALYAGVSDCTAGLSAVPLALCTLGIRNVAGHGVENLAGQYLDATPTSGIAKFVGTRGQYGDNVGITGRAWFIQTASDPANATNNEMYVKMIITGLQPYTRHAAHVHLWGDITGGDGLSAGLHFNPLDSIHGYPPSLIRHMGDMGNVTTDADGTIIFDDFFNLQTLTGASGNLIGRAVIIHSLGDDANTLHTITSTGAAGGRLAKGVIAISNRVPIGLDIAAARIEVAARHAAEEEAARLAGIAAAEALAAAEAAASATTTGSLLVATPATTIRHHRVATRASKTAPSLGPLSPA